jgi:aspartate/methionine/tyrosine aminotransferase
MATSRTEAAALASRAIAARRSAIREVFDAANKLPDAIRLEIGEPSFHTPRFVVDAAFEAAAAGRTGYTPNGGYASLRELLAEKIERVDGFAVDPDAVVVTPGAMNALFSIYLALLEPGDEVLLPTPGFPNMDEMVRLLGGEPVFYRLARESGYLPSRAELEPLVTPRTKAIFANTPGNPTGAVFPSDTVRGLAELAAELGVWLVSDEVYDELILDDLPHVSAAALVPGAPVVSVYSFSKVYAMTGWRLGYCAAPPQLADVLRKLQEPQVSCPSAISQHAAEAVLRGPRDEFATGRSRPPPPTGSTSSAPRAPSTCWSTSPPRDSRRASSRCGCSTTSGSRSLRVRSSVPADPGSCVFRSRSSRTSWPRAWRGSPGPSRRSRRDGRCAARVPAAAA